ncbi:hypothetical protein VCHENC02_3366A, partial [Vibrio harveyi]
MRLSKLVKIWASSKSERLKGY